MAAIDTTRTFNASKGFFATTVSVFGTMMAWKEARATRNALSSLSDRELDDIGLVRGDIDAIARR